MVASRSRSGEGRRAQGEQTGISTITHQPQRRRAATGFALARRALSLWLLVSLPIVVTLVAVGVAISGRSEMIDFQYGFLDAARAILHGHSPYPQSPSELGSGEAFVYPPALAILLVPFAVMPAAAASLLWASMLLAAVAGGLWILGVRDYRCYGAVALWHCTLATEISGAASGFLVLLAALVWIWRDSVWRAAAAAGAAITLKLFLWPLVLWLVLTRRVGAALRTTVVGGALILGSWALIGFADLGRYPRILRDLAKLEGDHGYSIAAAARVSGLPVGLVEALAITACMALVGWSLRLHGEQRDRALFCSFVIISLVMTPVAWAHYFVLLAVPCALASPRFSLLWLVPLLPYVAAPSQGSDGNPLSFSGYLAVVIIVSVGSLRLISTGPAPAPTALRRGPIAAWLEWRGERLAAGALARGAEQGGTERRADALR